MLAAAAAAAAARPAGVPHFLYHVDGGMHASDLIFHPLDFQTALLYALLTWVPFCLLGAHLPFLSTSVAVLLIIA